MPHKLLQGDSLSVLKTLPENSIHCAITSPPYFGLRNYQVDGQIGLETTIDEYIKKLVRVFSSVKRVLRDDGSLWVVMGDNYATNPPGNKTLADNMEHGTVSRKTQEAAYLAQKNRKIPLGVKPKDLMATSWALAIALRDDGWYFRSACPWIKRNALPDSTTDRPGNSVEYVFLFAKSPKYFYDSVAVKRTKPDGTLGRNRRNGDWWFESVGMLTNENGEPLGFDINTGGGVKGHYAAFPPKLIEPMIQASTSDKGCCSICGSPHIRISEAQHKKAETMRDGEWEADAERMGITGTEGRGGRLRVGLDRKSQSEKNPSYVTVGWEPSCKCNGEIVPCTVLDPFSGSGTTGFVAKNMGRDYIGIELNPEYIALSEQRLNGA